MSLSLFEAEPRFNSASMSSPRIFTGCPTTSDGDRSRQQLIVSAAAFDRAEHVERTEIRHEQVVSATKQGAGRRGQGLTRVAPVARVHRRQKSEESLYVLRRATMHDVHVLGRERSPLRDGGQPPTSTNSTPLAASRESRVVSSAGGEAIIQFLNGSQHAVVLTQALLRRERQHRVDERHVQCPGVDVVRGSSRLVHEDNCTRSIVRTHRSPAGSRHRQDHVADLLAARHVGEGFANVIQAVGAVDDGAELALLPPGRASAPGCP